MSQSLDGKAFVTAFIHKPDRESHQAGFRPERFVGPDAVVDRYFSRRPAMSSLDVTDDRVLSTDQPGVLLVTCRSEGECTAGGTHADRHARVFRPEGEELVEFQEFFDPRPVNRAHGQVSWQLPHPGRRQAAVQLESAVMKGQACRV